MNNFYRLTIHNYDEGAETYDWMDYQQFIDIHGKQNFKTYLAIEKQFIEAMDMFYKFFSSQKYFNPLVVKICVYENDGNKTMPCDINKLISLSSKDFCSLNAWERKFVYKCQCRMMCSLWFIEVSNMSYMQSIMDPFFLQIYLNPIYNIEDIFKKLDKVYLYYYKDILNEQDDYEIPENCGEKIIL